MCADVGTGYSDPYKSRKTHQQIDEPRRNHLGFFVPGSGAGPTVWTRFRDLPGLTIAPVTWLVRAIALICGRWRGVGAKPHRVSPSAQNIVFIDVWIDIQFCPLLCNQAVSNSSLVLLRLEFARIGGLKGRVRIVGRSCV